MLILDRKNLRLHAPWICVFIVGTVAAVVFDVAVGRRAERWPGGSSPVGLAFGVAGALIIGFEFLLWPRRWRWIRAWRIGRTQTWLRAHIWLGLLCGPLVWLHTGFTWGGAFSALLAWVFIAVIASGVVGVVLQQYLPRLLLQRVPAETVYAQIDQVAAQAVKDANSLISTLTGRTIESGQAAPDEPAEFVVVGAVRTVGRIQGKVLQTQSRPIAPARLDLLYTAYIETVQPYLKSGHRSGSRLQQPQHAVEFFRQLRNALDPELHYAADSLETWCENRRQFDLQSRIHWWLHSWLAVHLPLSIALMILLVAHVYVAVKYW